MILQHSSELAIRAALFLAQQAPGKLSPVHEIAAQLGVSKAYLAKVTQRLVATGLVRSFRGPGKGRTEAGRLTRTVYFSIHINNARRRAKGATGVRI
jgi:Rrf2 family protein